MKSRIAKEIVGCYGKIGMVGRNTIDLAMRNRSSSGGSAVETKLL
jgi:hypothetical protein